MIEVANDGPESTITKEVKATALGVRASLMCAIILICTVVLVCICLLRRKHASDRSRTQERKAPSSKEVSHDDNEYITPIEGNMGRVTFLLGSHNEARVNHIPPRALPPLPHSAQNRVHHVTELYMGNVNYVEPQTDYH
ncbi:unnamed protein product [Lymnaea stagnalis]|uniref:Uncharacterized protein n=1 Tax=Lymnaea stagnalis TaxID=6523 RepID=A0AAV2HPR2_LYMST